MRPVRLVLSLAAGLVLVSGCAAGPDYERPQPIPDAGYLPPATPVAASSTHSGESGSPRLVDGMDIPAQWWQVFHAAQLDALISQALAHNPDLAAAQDALDQARELVLAQRGSLYPSVSAGFTASRQKSSAQLSPTPASGALIYSLFTPQLTVSYTPDIFGLNRRTLEALAAQTDQARFALVAAHLTLSATVVTTVITLAGLQAQLDAGQLQVDLAERQVTALRRQYLAGYASRLDLATQEAQAAQARAALPPLRKALAQQRDLLGDLLGGAPNQVPALGVTLATLRMPSQLPLSLPSQLVAQRPDVRQAEANLHAACARVGIAAAARLPSVTLSGDLGAMALTAGSILTGGTSIWGIAAGVTQPLFDAGTLRHEERAAQAAYRQAAEQYRSTVLAAFENVADTLHALDEDGHAERVAQEGLDSAAESLQLVRQQLASGYAAELTVLTAESTYQQAVGTLAQAQANRLTDAAALFQALGGGWWHQPDQPTP